ncbi:nuclear transport factor 2 family protein [Saccharospirillum salsuginis]|uniref:SnoaL-like domain-containing protein n=1 Tax=Saccharospirillum salsuginis TaxID=418750 RepID=A0A918N5Q7_9GAMM|nr:nuclear transport factor 2 family protein [Saccharospirillum salsuginis]GGX40074.1 hypothetical protein GCM10007392_03350 [Saccharospirillum salsuginis]
MPDCIKTFFEAWQIEEAEARLTKITSAVTEHIEYVDPRTPQAVHGVAALSDYVGMFSANAPGWSAKVVASDSVANFVRAKVAFSGKGPDGAEQVQIGQYFVELEGDLISRMVGFVGTGE